MKFLERPYAITDVETTGLDFRVHEIIEIGMVLAHPDTLDTLDTFEIKVAPEHIETASERALKINGYDPQNWQGAVSLKEATEKYAEKTKNAVFVAHNITFDWGFIDEAFKKTGVKNLMDYHRIDTWTAAHERLRKSGLDKFSLQDLCVHLGIPPEPPVHRAINGALKVREVYQKLRSL